MFSIEEVQAHLDTLDRVKRRLGREKRKRVDASEYAELVSVLGDIFDSTTMYGEASARLGIAQPTLSKFLKMRGTVDVRTIRAVNDRLRTFVRSEDHVTPPDRPPEVLAQAVAPPLTFRGEQWLSIPRQSDVGRKIADLSALLGNIIEHVSGSNLSNNEQALTRIEREQLIAILETALALLKSPMVEKGLLRKAGEGLKNAAGRAAEKQTQEGLGKLAGAAVKKLGELYDLLSW